ncbi:diguanylate cyclase DgcJ [Citrobacter sedlakii]|uniref:diguanylate cyclase DgcJ n=1 Tax=Citrobacter sedlakii TaxID=67826 RepID=UPI003337B045
MKLPHKALRLFISASVVVLTSSFLIYELVNSHKMMNAYMRYLIEKADSSFLYDKYQNQSIAAHLMRTFASPQKTPPPEKRRAICQAYEHVNQVYGLNLTRHNYPALHGTLQTASADCEQIAPEALRLTAFDRAVLVNYKQADYGNGLATRETKFRYYLDLQDHYIYFYRRINTRQFAMHHWHFLQKGSLGINMADIDGVFTGRTVLSSIYQDDRTELNVMSFLTPVYLDGTLKGMVMVDINKQNLQNILYPHDRPLVWRYLNAAVTDTDSGKTIIIHQSENNLFPYVRYVVDLPGGLHVALSLDILYFLMSAWKIFLFYLIATALLLNMVRLHFRLYHNVTRENISDAMTGLYNRKILTPTLEQRLQRFVSAGTPVTFIAIDLDKLKQINDTQGHQEGDRAITLLAKAIEASVRKSDYAIRLGGDEFCVILIDAEPDMAARLPERISQHLHTVAPEKAIRFSSGVYSMQPDDTLHDAYKASDEQLYRNKQQNHQRS